MTSITRRIKSVSYLTETCRQLNEIGVSNPIRKRLLERIHYNDCRKIQDEISKLYSNKEKGIDAEIKLLELLDQEYQTDFEVKNSLYLGKGLALI